MLEEQREAEFKRMLLELEERHRVLDDDIRELEINPFRDQLRVRRLKKEKLRLKDCMEVLRNKLIPDLDA